MEPTTPEIFESENMFAQYLEDCEEDQKNQEEVDEGIWERSYEANGGTYWRN